MSMIGGSEWMVRMALRARDRTRISPSGGPHWTYFSRTPAVLPPATKGRPDSGILKLYFLPGWCHTWHMPQPHGFDYSQRGDDVLITHHGRRATVLRGSAAAAFLEDVGDGDAQLLMARVTGHYAHGNERTARNHPRNRGR